MLNKFIFLTVLVVCLAGCCKKEKPAGTAYSVAHVENCKGVNEDDIKDLFNRWNSSLGSLDEKQVVAKYAVNSTLLPTIFDPNFNGMLITEEQKEGYFKGFLSKKPQGRITSRQIYIGCNTAVDTGLYTFTYLNPKLSLFGIKAPLIFAVMAPL